VRETDIYFKQSSDVSQTKEMTQFSLEMTMFKYFGWTNIRINVLIADVITSTGKNGFAERFKILAEDTEK